jgi:hypothetical protein
MTETSGYDAEGDAVERDYNPDGSEDATMSTPDGGEYEGHKDADGYAHVEGVSGDGTYLSVDEDPQGNVVDAYEEDRQGDQVALERNPDGTYDVQEETGDGHYYAADNVDLDS